MQEIKFPFTISNDSEYNSESQSITIDKKGDKFTYKSLHFSYKMSGLDYKIKIYFGDIDKSKVESLYSKSLKEFRWFRRDFDQSYKRFKIKSILEARRVSIKSEKLNFKHIEII